MAAVARKLTFAEHIHELRRRLMWSLLFVALGAGLGYVLHDAILNILQQPLNEKLYYTNPTGAFSFIIKICSVFGLIAALPVIMYQAFGFFEPLLPVKTRRQLVWYVFLSMILAAAGILFAYLISLPAALHFLVNFGSESGNIQALITANEYFNFVLAYIAGFAVLFQLPLIITFINKVTPLKPSQLIGGTRYVILGSFIVAAIITPTPDPLNQALMAGPIILLYFLSVVVIAMANGAKRRKKKKASVPEMIIAGIEELIEEKPTQIARPVVSSPTPVVAASQTVVHRQRFVNDMVLPASRKTSLAPVRQQRTFVSQPPAQQSRPSMRMGVISDFIPASE